MAELRLHAPGQPSSYGYATFFDLDRDPDAPPGRFRNVVSMGRRALIERWQRDPALGVTHVALNLKPSRRPVPEVLDELAEHVLPLFSNTD